MYRFLRTQRMGRKLKAMFYALLLQWVTVFELATPLVLFFLLLGLRIREPVSKFDGSEFAMLLCLYISREPVLCSGFRAAANSVS